MEGNVALFEFNLKLTLPPEMQQLQEWVLERAAGSQREMNQREPTANTRSSGMTGQGSTDEFGRAIVRLLGWILLFDILDGD